MGAEIGGFWGGFLLLFLVDKSTEPVVEMLEEPGRLDADDQDADVDEYYEDRREKYVKERAKDVFVAGAMRGKEEIG